MSSACGAQLAHAFEQAQQAALADFQRVVFVVVGVEVLAQAAVAQRRGGRCRARRRRARAGPGRSGAAIAARRSRNIRPARGQQPTRRGDVGQRPFAWRRADTSFRSRTARGRAGPQGGSAGSMPHLQRRPRCRSRAGAGDRPLRPTRAAPSRWRRRRRPRNGRAPAPRPAPAPASAGAVTARSAALGSGLPLGWLWPRISAAALCCQRPPRDFARVHLGAVEGAAEQLLVGDHAVPGVEEQAGEDLVRQRPQLAREVGAGLRRVGQRLAALQLLAEVARAELERGRQRAGARRPQARAAPPAPRAAGRAGRAGRRMSASSSRPRSTALRAARAASR